jgi:hypothetical protein
MNVRQLPSRASALAKSAQSQRRSQNATRLLVTPALAGVFLVFFAAATITPCQYELVATQVQWFNGWSLRMRFVLHLQND